MPNGLQTRFPLGVLSSSYTKSIRHSTTRLKHQKVNFHWIEWRAKAFLFRLKCFECNAKKFQTSVKQKSSCYQQLLSPYLRVCSRCHYQHERNFVCFQSRINYMQTKRGETIVRPSYIHVYVVVTFNANSDIVLGRIAQFYL